ncbi:hypothetical protein J6590_004068 [Homalodisca vitripennis]|nr:hypothetical protein J6590_004068 [Homalodisca vitripennis]
MSLRSTWANLILRHSSVTRRGGGRLNKLSYHEELLIRVPRTCEVKEECVFLVPVEVNSKDTFQACDPTKIYLVDCVFSVKEKGGWRLLQACDPTRIYLVCFVPVEDLLSVLRARGGKEEGDWRLLQACDPTRIYLVCLVSVKVKRRATFTSIGGRLLQSCDPTSIYLVCLVPVEGLLISVPRARGGKEEGARNRLISSGNDLQISNPDISALCLKDKQFCAALGRAASPAFILLKVNKDRPKFLWPHFDGTDYDELWFQQGATLLVKELCCSVKGSRIASFLGIPTMAIETRPTWEKWESTGAITVTAQVRETFGSEITSAGRFVEERCLWRCSVLYWMWERCVHKAVSESDVTAVGTGDSDSDSETGTDHAPCPPSAAILAALHDTGSSGF